MIFHSLEDCLNAFQNETERTVFIIGGGEIYKMALELNCLDELYITYVQGVFGADTFFPAFDESQFQKSIVAHQAPDEKHAQGFVITKYLKKN